MKITLVSWAAPLTLLALGPLSFIEYWPRFPGVFQFLLPINTVKIPALAPPVHATQ